MYVTGRNNKPKSESSHKKHKKTDINFNTKSDLAIP